MTAVAEPLQRRHQRLVEAIEARFEVAGWRNGDVDLWPPARLDLFLDLFRSEARDTAPPPPAPLLRAASNLALPLTNLWRSRGDLAHWVPDPYPASAVLLGDGVSLDRVDGAWRDRHGEPVLATLERQGEPTFVMQPGPLNRLPWKRATYAANLVAMRGALGAALARQGPLELPDHAAVLAFLRDNGVEAPSLTAPRLTRRAGSLAATALAFQRVLRLVRPRIAFTVTWYAGLGPAFALACRREGVMCVDLQHCPHEGAHRAYRWERLPARGYSTLPAVFWTWSAADADAVAAWADGAWHRAIHGGHSQLAPFLDDDSPETPAWDARFAAIGDPGPFEREIVVALQPIGGRRTVWEALARQIESSPSSWRWWIRRHPSAARHQDAEHGALLALSRPNVIVGEAGELPLPALLRHMDVVVSLASGAAVEAAMFGVPALFLDDEARVIFGKLIDSGRAEVIEAGDVLHCIAWLSGGRTRPLPEPAPTLDETLQRLDALAADYTRLCRERPLGRRGLG